MARCYGINCPLAEDCYRFTNPYHGRNFLGNCPYDKASNSCEYFITNIPKEESIQTKAYFLWLSKGKPSGEDVDIWLNAQNQCKESLGRKK